MKNYGFSCRIIFSAAREIYCDDLTNNRLQRFSTAFTPDTLRLLANVALTNPKRSQRALEDLVEWACLVMTRRKDLIPELAQLKVLIINYWDEQDRVYLANCYNRLRQRAEEILGQRGAMTLRAHIPVSPREAKTKHG